MQIQIQTPPPYPYMRDIQEIKLFLDSYQGDWNTHNNRGLLAKYSDRVTFTKNNQHYSMDKAQINTYLQDKINSTPTLIFQILSMQIRSIVSCKKVGGVLEEYVHLAKEVNVTVKLTKNNSLMQFTIGRDRIEAYSSRPGGPLTHALPPTQIDNIQILGSFYIALDTKMQCARDEITWLIIAENYL